jgi:hypothetical protein
MASRKNTEDVTINDRKNQAHSGIPCCRSALEKKKKKEKQLSIRYKPF